MCHFLIWCRVREGNSLLLNGFAEIMHRQRAPERSEENKWNLVFIPQSPNYPLKLTIWNDVNLCTTIIGLIWGRAKYTGFHLARKKEAEFILNRKEKKRYLMKAKETSCPNPLTKKRQKEWVFEIMFRPKNNVSIIFLIVSFHPEHFFFAKKIWNLTLEWIKKLYFKDCLMKWYFLGTKENESYEKGMAWGMYTWLHLWQLPATCIQIRHFWCWQGPQRSPDLTLIVNKWQV